MDYAPLNVLWNTSQSSVVNEPCRWKAGTRSEIPRVADPVLVDDITENKNFSSSTPLCLVYLGKQNNTCITNVYKFKQKKTS